MAVLIFLPIFFKLYQFLQVEGHISQSDDLNYILVGSYGYLLFLRLVNSCIMKTPSFRMLTHAFSNTSYCFKLK